MKPEISILLISALVLPVISEARQDYGRLPGDWAPISKVAPIYPNSALDKCISGWVIVGFTLSVDGTPKDMKVIASFPKGHFESSALEALAGNRYIPRTENGVPSEMPDMKEKLSYEIPDNYPCPNT